MKRMKNKFAMLLLFAVSASCGVMDDSLKTDVETSEGSADLALCDVATMLSSVPIQDVHVKEVHQAVLASSANGYDEEYTMKHLFEKPGVGVGGESTKGESLANPLCGLISEHLQAANLTKAGAGLSADELIGALTSSDIQIYWPYSDSWDGETFPIITFDPENGELTNKGYEVVVEADGTRGVKEVIVDEKLAMERPVWVINRNSDAGYTTLESLSVNAESGEAEPETKSNYVGRSLVLKEILAKRNYDNWFAGASEFWVKIGAVEDFTAVTEAEMYLYNPSVTDFMVVMKRGQIGVPQKLNVLLVSNWTDQMVNCAFMITEDDGGTRTSWDCTALVRVESKSYGIEMKLPLNSRDDIVWRGQLASKWLESHNNVAGNFGDLEVTFEVVEY